MTRKDKILNYNIKGSINRRKNSKNRLRLLEYVLKKEEKNSVVLGEEMCAYVLE